MAIDLTGGEVRVIGNHGDKHLFRLKNPEGQDIINVDGEYQAIFISVNQSSSSHIPLDLSEITTGALIFLVTISSGFYRIRRLNPRRTILTIEVESR